MSMQGTHIKGRRLRSNFIITFQRGVGGGFIDYGERLVWAPRLRLGLGAAF